jgi:hypothetical protein
LAILGYVALAVLVTIAPERQPSWTGPPGPDLAFVVALQDAADMGATDLAP